MTERREENNMDWFTVDKNGLAKLLEKKGKAFAIFELIQNAWDTDAKRVEVEVTPVPGKPLCRVVVTDDHPEGFKSLAHAFTLFAESEKKADPTKRGRFNLGEKLVLALCESAEIISTKGSIYFTPEGRVAGRKRLQAGSAFIGTLRMTREEQAEVERAVLTLIPPEVETTFNGAKVPQRPAIESFEATLPTEIADAEGFLRKSARKTMVTVHEVRDGETPTIYEMGIPVVELSGGERWHVNVHQKIPLNIDRDNVTPAYLQTLRVFMASAMKTHLTKVDADQIWTAAATADPRVDSDVVEKVLDSKFGKQRAIFDPSDFEANKTLMNSGYTIVPGGALSKGQWANVKAAGLIAPSGQIRPSGKLYSPDGRPEKTIDPDGYTAGQKRVVEYARGLSPRLLGYTVGVRIVCEITERASAWFGDGCLTFNLGRLGKAWFETPLGTTHTELILHEFAHDRVKDHLTHEFSDEIARLGAKLVEVAIYEPSFFHQYYGKS